MRREIVEIKGRVQGVGFRYTVSAIAGRHPVSGTVRNLRSGAVEIDVEGDDDIVEAFIDDVLAHPPRMARVDAVARRSAEPRGIRGFDVGSDG